MLIGLSLEQELTWLPPKEPELHGRQVNIGTELRALLGSGVGGGGRENGSREANMCPLKVP